MFILNDYVFFSNIAEDCGGVNYKDIYSVLWDAMNGEVPKNVNEATAKKILEMMSELRESALGKQAIIVKLLVRPDSNIDKFFLYRQTALPF